MIVSNLESQLINILLEKCYIEGDFRLSSGKKSSIYFDCKNLLLDFEGCYLFSQWIIDKINNMAKFPDYIGGPEIGAIPITTSVIMTSYKHIDGFIVRNLNKNYGTCSNIHGNLFAGARVVVVDDVLTTGKSICNCIEQLENIGCKIEKIFCLLDRQEKRIDKFNKYENLVEPCITFEKVLEGKKLPVQPT